MHREYNYQRSYKLSRRGNNLIDLGNAGVFKEIIFKNCTPPDESVIKGHLFTSIHTINMPTGERVFTAFRSEEEPGVLLTVWGGIPFHLHIEEGGDLMLQVLYSDKRVKHLLIDNTYVRSLWMKEKKTVEYLENGWLPGLIQLELKGMCHLESERLLGKLSFEEFGQYQSESIKRISARLEKDPFRYFPLKISEIDEDKKSSAQARDLALAKALEILESI